MPFITFIYRVGKNSKTYYGKYCLDYISEDHDGLDNEIKYILKEGINEYRKQNNMPKLKSKIMIGVLSFSSNQFIPTFSTNHEIKCFDFYRNYDGEIYVNGKII
jgi:ribosomal protein S8